MPVLYHFISVGVQFQEREQHQGHTPEGRSSVTDQRQRDPDYRYKTDGHADIDGKMEK